MHEGYVFSVIGSPFAHVIFVHNTLGDAESIFCCDIGEIVGAEDDVEHPVACCIRCGEELPIRLPLDVIEAVRGRH